MNKPEEKIKCICEVCGAEYEKPLNFKTWLDEGQGPNVFFRWSLKFCDKHRREKEQNALKSLPAVLNAIANIKPKK